jgi:hypothetical protein
MNVENAAVCSARSVYRTFLARQIKSYSSVPEIPVENRSAGRQISPAEEPESVAQRRTSRPWLLRGFENLVPGGRTRGFGKIFLKMSAITPA